ncbi:HNH endonuclease signature motif containing protein [Mycolicibacterium holsaticum]|uniref:HNH endonuclease signature motif containing protein n=2 Tax=Mycolicibacterium holsaticum TaxID=152142 RepID=UPI001C7D0392|nr:HNH endonuclease signature motif containing protein [Mycolicibacterium holsaticum]QZA11348.1 HNH endonuclease [Mycolicibacterium holsaticum DSM 44478 = JCM 12374]
MSVTASAAEGVEFSPARRLDGLFDELGELMGQRNVIDARMVEIIAEIDHDQLWGATGARSIPALVAWKTGASLRNAHAIAAAAHRFTEFPICADSMRQGRVSLDQFAVIAEHAGAGSDAHYAQLIENATVSQLRTAIKLEPRPQPDPQPDIDPDIEADTEGEAGGEGEGESGIAPDAVAEPALDFDCDSEVSGSVLKSSNADGSTTWKVTLPPIEAAQFEAALSSQREALMIAWKRDHHSQGHTTLTAPPLPTTTDAFMHLIQTGWDAQAARRPHGTHTTVVVHLDVNDHIAGLHLGPILSDADRRYLLCDATAEVWWERDGQPIGAGRSTRHISRRLRRALEHRDRTCVVPGCGATRALHAHHIVHWEDGGPTDLDNLVLVCPYHHRLHHRRAITITGPAHNLIITDHAGRRLTPRSLAHPPTQPPPTTAPYRGPTGETAQWWWYQPYQPPPQPPPNN